MGINHTVMNPGWVTAHQRTHEGPSVHERDPLMWGIALFRFINCVIGNEGNLKYIDWNVSLENIMTFSHYGFTNLLFNFRTPFPKINCARLQTLQMSDLTTWLLKWTYLFFNQSFFSHSVNCSDRVSVKIDHGSVNRPPIPPPPLSFLFT